LSLWTGLFLSGRAFPQAEKIISETFDGEASMGMILPNRPDALCGFEAAQGANSACIDDLLQTNGGPGKGRLLLTQPFNHQTGYAWFTDPLNLPADKITVDFDFFISGGSSPPGDGLSLIFQLGDDATAIGRGGGALGTGGFPSDYVSVAFDVFDNGPADPESSCDGVLNQTCHVEVNQNSNPEVDPPLAASIDVPSFIDAGSADVPIHATVTLNGLEILVVLSTPFGNYGAHEVIHALLHQAPERGALLGFAGTTGSFNSSQAIDNVDVTREPIDPPSVEWEPPADRGGINCGGESLSVTAGGSTLEVASDGLYGEIVEVVSGAPTVFKRRGHGRLPAGDDGAGGFTAEIKNLADPSIAPLYQSEASSRKEILYRYNVLPGRYEVTLYFAENCPCGIDRDGRGTRRYDVLLGESEALLFFSPAEAAGKALGSCTALLSTAITRTFLLDVRPDESGLAVLQVRVKDLGGGNPPENAQLNGFSFLRRGDASGEPIQGDLENNRLPPPIALEPPRTVVNADFDAFPDGTDAAEALAGLATVNPGRFFKPVIQSGRLRLADDTRLLSATSVLFDGGGTLVFDPLAVELRAEFDVFLSNPDGNPAADGLVFGILQGAVPKRVGGPGGSLGFADIGAPGIGVEVDLWEGGGFGDDSGYNTDGQGHLAIVGSGASPATVDHVEDQNDFDRSLDGEGWVNVLSPSGFHIEVAYSPQARLDVFLTALDGSFARRQVLGAFVTPFTGHQAMAGFFSATGGETATMEVDNFKLDLSSCVDLPEASHISGDREVTVALDASGSAVLDLDGSSSTAGEAAEELLYAWSVEGPFAGAALESPCRAKTKATFAVPAKYKVSLAVDDRHCSLGPEASDSITVNVKDASPSFLRGDTNCDRKLDISDAVLTLTMLFLGTGSPCCGDASDTNDDGRMDISDPVFTLNFLFLGGNAPKEPYPACGGDPTDDILGCERFPACG
jgi:hypothetical protein